MSHLPLSLFVSLLDSFLMILWFYNTEVSCSCDIVAEEMQKYEPVIALAVPWADCNLLVFFFLPRLLYLFLAWSSHKNNCIQSLWKACFVHTQPHLEATGHYKIHPSHREILTTETAHFLHVSLEKCVLNHFGSLSFVFVCFLCWCQSTWHLFISAL